MEAVRIKRTKFDQLVQSCIVKTIKKGRKIYVPEQEETVMSRYKAIRVGNCTFRPRLVINTTPEERKEIVRLTLWQMIENVPVLGSLLNNVFFEYRSNIKQARLNKFVEALEEELADMDINPTSLQTEESVDLFDTVFRKVTDTRNEKKRGGLKNILGQGLKHQGQIEYCELFAEHLLSFLPKELEILAAHQSYVLNGKGPLPRKNELKEELHELGLRYQPLNNAPIMLNLRPKPGVEPRPVHIVSKENAEAKKMLEQYEKEMVAEKFGISEDELRFFIQNLQSKGLLRDDGAGAIGVRATEIMSITSLGLKF